MKRPNSEIRKDRAALKTLLRHYPTASCEVFAQHLNREGSGPSGKPWNSNSVADFIRRHRLRARPKKAAPAVAASVRKTPPPAPHLRDLVPAVFASWFKTATDDDVRSLLKLILRVS
jgi:hypothetical protein